MSLGIAFIRFHTPPKSSPSTCAFRRAAPEPTAPAFFFSSFSEKRQKHEKRALASTGARFSGFLGPENRPKTLGCTALFRLFFFPSPLLSRLPHLSVDFAPRRKQFDVILARLRPYQSHFGFPGRRKFSASHGRHVDFRKPHTSAPRLAQDGLKTAPKRPRAPQSPLRRSQDAPRPRMIFPRRP